MEVDRRLVEGDQRRGPLRQGVERGVDPGQCPGVEAPLVTARDGGVAHQDRGAGDVVDLVDGAALGRLAQQGLSVGGARIVVAGAGQHGEGGGQDAFRLLVLGLLAVIGDVPGDQDGVDGMRQGAQVVHDASGTSGRPLGPVQVQVADVRQQRHRSSSLFSGGVHGPQVCAGSGAATSTSNGKSRFTVRYSRGAV